MTKAEILEELLNLTVADRQETRLKLAELDGDSWPDDDHPLTDEEKALLETRLADMKHHPENSILWDEARRRIEERFPFSNIGV